MPIDTMPDDPFDPPDYKGRVCRDCHHFAMHDDLGGGDCREAPPVVTPPVNDERAVYQIRYPSHVPGTPACSRFTTPSRWRDWQRAFWGLVASDLGRPIRPVRPVPDPAPPTEPPGTPP